MMIAMLYFLSFTLLLTASDTPSREKAFQEPPPNIIIVFADDLGYADVAGFGVDHTSTPYLQQLATEGVKLTNFYAMPSCSPSRAALLTGCYPQRVGIPWVVGPEGRPWTEGKSNVGLNPKEETVAELLKEAGYQTACIGKWHLGHHAPHLPTHHGFDVFFGLPYSNDMWPGSHPVYQPLTLIEGEQVVDTVATLADQAQLTGRYTRRATEFITAHQDNPFFLYLAHSMPHVPINTTLETSDTSATALYDAVIREIDASVGSIMRTLDSLKLADNTLLIFTSDNGPWLVYGNHAGSAAPLREGKQTTFEGGVRVPFVARWPDKIPADQQITAVAGLIDLLPTLVGVSGAPSPSLPIDGQSIWPLLTGKSSESPREAHYFFRENELQAVRKGKWKLHLPHAYQTVVRAGSDGQRGKAERKRLALSLYNLTDDPGERTNLASGHPAVVQELRALAKDFALEIHDNQRPPGRFPLAAE